MMGEDWVRSMGEDKVAPGCESGSGKSKPVETSRGMKGRSSLLVCVECNRGVLAGLSSKAVMMPLPPHICVEVA